MFPLRDSVPTRRFPFVNYFLIAVNIAVFLKEIQMARLGRLDMFINGYALIPSHFFANPSTEWPHIFYAMFLHGGWGHLLGNMWFLHIFGDNVEDNLGHGRYFFYYLFMGIGAAACQLAASRTSLLPMIGASGAIAGILGSYFILFPGARVLTLVPIFVFIRVMELPAYFFLGLWFVIQAFNGFGMLATGAMRGEMGGVAWWAHAGGFLTGFLCIPFLRRRRRF